MRDVRPRLVPKEYFLVTGTGESETSVLNAFDRALVAAGISQCNLVPVSSILPKGAKEVKPKKIEPGEITFVVMGKSSGKCGDRISAGIAIGYTEDGENDVIVEFDQNGSTDEARLGLSDRISEMAAARGWKVSRIRHETCEIKATKTYGVALAAVVLLL